MAAPRDRPAVRAIVLDDDDRVLLLRIAANDDGLQLWLTPGGGRDPGESDDAALRRELFEEIGVEHPVIGPCVWTRENVFRWKGEWLRALERFHVVRIHPNQLGRGAPEEHELDAPRRWFSVDELRTLNEVFVPRDMPGLLARLLQDGEPNVPIDAGD